MHSFLDTAAMRSDDNGRFYVLDDSDEIKIQASLDSGVPNLLFQQHVSYLLYRRQ